MTHSAKPHSALSNQLDTCLELRTNACPVSHTHSVIFYKYCIDNVWNGLLGETLHLFSSAPSVCWSFLFFFHDCFCATQVIHMPGLWNMLCFWNELLATSCEASLPFPSSVDSNINSSGWKWDWQLDLDLFPLTGQCWLYSNWNFSQFWQLQIHSNQLLVFFVKG